jgi:hypothetical protein
MYPLKLPPRPPIYDAEDERMNEIMNNMTKKIDEVQSDSTTPTFMFRHARSSIFFRLLPWSRRSSIASSKRYRRSSDRHRHKKIQSRALPSRVYRRCLSLLLLCCISPPYLRISAQQSQPRWHTRCQFMTFTFRKIKSREVNR